MAQMYSTITRRAVKMFTAQIIAAIRSYFLEFTPELPTFATDKKKQEQGTAIVPFFFTYGSTNGDNCN